MNANSDQEGTMLTGSFGSVPVENPEIVTRKLLLLSVIGLSDIQKRYMTQCDLPETGRSSLQDGLG